MSATAVTMESLFGIDVRTLDHLPDFKEDSVREIIILPLLEALGYKRANIVRSKSLLHPFLKIGSKKRAITLIPDYSLTIDNAFPWVLDAKAPSESVTDQEHIEQVYSYATHPEIRSTYFALCNGKDFALYRREFTNEPVLNFSLSEIEHYWEKLKTLLSPESFHSGKDFTYDTTTATAKPSSFDYRIRPLLEEIPVKKQSAKRHFGVHGYFTKQSWNVVQEYIKHFSKPGDLVLDPFGGSGITAIEAMMCDRKAIHIDLNPLSVFMVQSLAAPIKLSELADAFERVKKRYLALEPKTPKEVKAALKKYDYPTGLKLPKDADVETIEELFTEDQLARLALLKHIIKLEKDANIRTSLMLSFSSSINKINKTFHYTKSEGGGDSGPFRYYRYRIAHTPGVLNLMDVFETKFKKVFAAKQEIQYKINDKTISNLKVYKGTATALKNVNDESIDYIYTDPPYGKKIPYLDLSIMWNGWLDLDVTKKDFQLEAIEGGEHDKSRESYNELIAASIREMFRVLKFDRWLSFVFAHQNPAFWHLIIDTAEKCGFEYMGAVPQKNGQSSFKKRQHPFTVLSGQLIINFRKVSNPRTIMKAHLGADIAGIVMQTIEGLIAKNNGATLEQINDELIIKGLELGFLDLLKKEYSDLSPILLSNFEYNSQTKLFTITKDGKFKSHLDVRLRIRYYIISYLRRLEREGKYPEFDEIVRTVLPLLRNGITPKNQTIRGVLEDIAEHSGEGQWRLKTNQPPTLFQQS